MYLSKGVRNLILAAIYGAVILTGISSTAAAQTARIQVIHNSPDPSVAWLSLYLNDIKVADTLLFRNAKPYVVVPAGIGIQAGFAPLSSTSSNDVFKTVTINLDPGKDYVAVILGVADPNYRPNPDGLPIGLTLLVAETRPLAASLESSDYLFINGTTDSPSLEFRPRKGDAIATDVPYGSVVGYAAYNKYVYTMDVAAAEAPERIFGFFDLDVGFLKDKAFTVLTSGFINRFDNGTGPEFKVMVVTSSGLTITSEMAEPTADVATMQVINNSPDLDFPNGFDVYFNGGRAIDDLTFRKATPRFGLPGNATVTLELKNTTGGLTIRSTALTVEPGKNYLVVINGVVNTSLYAKNPDGEPTDLAFSINPNMRRFPSQLGVGEFVFVHGIPDAPTADMQITGLTSPISNVPFGEITAYHAISEFDILAEMVASNDDLPVILSRRVGIPFVLGKTFVLYSSGFWHPEENRNGEPAQLWIALDNGALVRLRFIEVAAEPAKLQLIHASADPGLQLVDLYVDYKLVARNATFMSGTPFVDIPSGKTITVSVTPPESEGIEGAITRLKAKFDDGVTYAGVMNGVMNPGDYAANPNGKSTALGLHVIDDVLDAGLDGSRLTVRLANEITDAPASNVIVESSQLLAQSIGFGQHGAYGIVPAAYRFVDVRRTAAATRVGASYIDFSGLAGRAGILVASGFADPAANGNGPGFSTFLVLDNGSTVQSDQNIVRTEDDEPEIPGVLKLHGNYPNPFTDATEIVIDLPQASEISVRVLDAAGRLVQNRAPELVPAGTGQTIRISSEDLPAGMYLYSVKVASASGAREIHGRMMLIR